MALVQIQTGLWQLNATFTMLGSRIQPLDRCESIRGLFYNAFRALRSGLEKIIVQQGPENPQLLGDAGC